MKSSLPKILKLNEQQLVEEFFESTQLIGLVSDLPDYQLCWHLNRDLDMDFRVNPDLVIAWKQNRRTYFFTVFEYLDTRSLNIHYLYNNYKQGIALLPEVKHMPYIWLIKGPFFSTNDREELLMQLKHFPYIRMATVLAQEDLKNRRNLIL
ncbi:MAG: IPExxxVDY family protein [Thermoflavifilum sp.]|nr:IPExxxVDY family protein [Thermoflavifilum sp.]